MIVSLRNSLLLLLLLPLAAPLAAPAVARRDLLGVTAASIFAAARPSSAASPALLPERAALLDSIASSSGDVESRIAALLPFDPSKGRAASSASLSGTWELIWSAKAEAFSPLLRLPPPLRPASFQLLGAAATAEVGEGRVAQVLTRGILGKTRLLLSSGVLPAADGSGETLEIFPPFRLQVERGGTKKTLVDAGSDASFRAVNGRDDDAQAAPKNRYAQTYLEETNGAGDLRISVITAGDPVIVGAVFVHQRL
jgi:hypothetical protein